MEPYSPKAFPCVLSGGDKRDRTADLLNAIQALSQLSYTPILALPFQGCFAIISNAMYLVKRKIKKKWEMCNLTKKFKSLVSPLK